MAHGPGLSITPATAPPIGPAGFQGVQIRMPGAAFVARQGFLCHLLRITALRFRLAGDISHPFRVRFHKSTPIAPMTILRRRSRHQAGRCSIRRHRFCLPPGSARITHRRTSSAFALFSSMLAGRRCERTKHRFASGRGCASATSGRPALRG